MPRARLDLPGPTNVGEPVPMPSTGAAYPTTPDGYYRITAKFTPGMDKFITEEGKKLETPKITEYRSRRILRPHSEADNAWYSQKSLPDMRYVAAWDINAKGDPRHYKKPGSYRRPPHMKKRNPMMASVPHIPRPVIISEQAVHNVFSRDNNALQMDDMDVGNHYGYSTVQDATPESWKKARMDSLARSIRRERNVYAKNRLIDMIRQGGDYDQGEFPRGLVGVGPKRSALPKMDVSTDEMQRRAPFDIHHHRAKNAEKLGGMISEAKMERASASARLGRHQLGAHYGAGMGKP